MSGRPRFVICGEALIDLVPSPEGGTYNARAGGSPANVAVGLGRLGTQVSLVARLAKDPFGRLLRAHLGAADVDLSMAIHAAEPSTLAVVSLDAGGKAEYAFYIDAAADGGWRVEDLPADLPDGATVHMSGSLALSVPSMGDALEGLLRREQGRRVLAFDPNVRPIIARDEAALRARLDIWVGLVDIVKVSSDDLQWIAPEVTVADQAARWRSLGPTLVVVTRGEQGVYAVGPAGPVDRPAAPVKVVDTVGAGDAFMSGLLAALDGGGHLSRSYLTELSTDRLTAALDFAQRVAALTCQRVGADPPWRSELG